MGATPANKLISEVVGLQTALDKGMRGVNPAKYRLVAAVIRKSGGTWSPIEDATHGNCGISSIEEVGSKVRVHFDRTFTKILSMATFPDETYAKNGIMFGASVGEEYIDIEAYRAAQSMSGYVSYSGSTWTVASGSTHNLAVQGYSAGTLTLTHDTMDAFGVSATARDGAYVAELGSCGVASMQVKFYDWAGTLVTTAASGMKLFVQRTHTEGAITDLADLELAGSNIWLLGAFEE